MAGDAPVAIRRSEYAPTPYAIDTVDLSFDLKEDVTRVTSLLSVKARTEGAWSTCSASASGVQL